MTLLRSGPEPVKLDMKRDSHLFGPKLLCSSVQSRHGYWGRALFVTSRAAPCCDYGSISPGVVSGWTVGHVAARTALSPPERAFDDSSRVRQIGLSRAHAAPSAGAPLHATYRCHGAASRSHHAAARQREG